MPSLPSELAIVVMLKGPLGLAVEREAMVSEGSEDDADVAVRWQWLDDDGESWNDFVELDSELLAKFSYDFLHMPDPGQIGPFTVNLLAAGRSVLVFRAATRAGCPDDAL